MWWILVAGAAAPPVDVDRPDGVSCEAGDGAACTRLGVLFTKGGEGLPLDPFVGARFFHQACDADNAAGCMFLAEAYRQGDGVLIDPTRAPELYTKACGLGAGLGCRSVGDLVVLGAVQNATPESATAWYQRGCELGDAQSCTASGLVAERDHETETSVPLFERGCELGHARACTLIAVRHAKGSDGVPRDPVAALRWYERGCTLQPFDPESCRELGWAEYQAIDPRAPSPDALAKAHGHLDEACYRNDTIACRYLARVAREAGETSEGLMAAERACDLGDQPACRIAYRLQLQLGRDL